ncbi:MAG: CPBP family intramembrane glutamic endopeptidase [Mycobacteriales bacterium]
MSALVGAGLLRRSLSTEPGSNRFYLLTSAVAATWLVGGSAAKSPATTPSAAKSSPLVVPIAVGAGTFGAFYAAARVARHVPVLGDALRSVMTYSHNGSEALVLATALVNGIGEEVFFRGAVYDAAGPRHPRAASTATYVAVTAATGNPALVLAAAVMGWLFATQRRNSGGIAAATVTHLMWSTLMLRYVPPLLADQLARRVGGSRLGIRLQGAKRPGTS